MSDIVITADNLSKSYLVGRQYAQRERYTALRDVVAREARNFARKTVDFMRGRQIVQGDEVERRVKPRVFGRSSNIILERRRR
jgi:lipopolysaccharide transport system ATP-binding protein